MKSNLPFFYLSAFFASHASCAPQGTYDESFHVSPGQACTVEGGIVRVPAKNKKRKEKEINFL